MTYAVDMTDAQCAALRAWRVQYDAIGWKVSVKREGGRIFASAYGGPRAMRSVFIATDGAVTAGPMA